MTFYIVIPFIVIFLKDWQIYCLSLLSFVIFLFAFNNTVNTDTYGYRLLPGTLFIFLYGWLLNKNTQSSRYFRYLMFLMVFLLAITLFLKDSKFYSYPYNKEVIIGFISGSIIVGVIKNIRFSSWDEFFGNISYGVFLNHFIVIWLLEVFLKRKVTGYLEIFFLLLISITLSIFSFYFIERPFLIKRKVLRNKG